MIVGDVNWFASSMRQVAWIVWMTAIVMLIVMIIEWLIGE